jgi:hypothetical protein
MLNMGPWMKLVPHYKRWMVPMLVVVPCVLITLVNVVAMPVLVDLAVGLVGVEDPVEDVEGEVALETVVEEEELLVVEVPVVVEVLDFLAPRSFLTIKTPSEKMSDDLSLNTLDNLSHINIDDFQNFIPCSSFRAFDAIVDEVFISVCRGIFAFNCIFFISLLSFDR